MEALVKDSPEAAKRMASDIERARSQYPTIEHIDIRMVELDKSKTVVGACALGFVCIANGFIDPVHPSRLAPYKDLETLYGPVLKEVVMRWNDYWGLSLDQIVLRLREWDGSSPDE